MSREKLHICVDLQDAKKLQEKGRRIVLVKRSPDGVEWVSFKALPHNEIQWFKDLYPRTGDENKLIVKLNGAGCKFTAGPKENLPEEIQLEIYVTADIEVAEGQLPSILSRSCKMSLDEAKGRYLGYCADTDTFSTRPESIISRKDLLNCPFCGGEARIERSEMVTWEKIHIPDNDGSWYSAFCTDCFAHSAECVTPDEAVEAWNMRI